jgi:hypothetical protein
MDDFKQYTEEIYKPVNSKFRRRTVRAGKINDIWSCDIMDMNDVSDLNDGYKYSLNIVDVFSKYAWVIPLKTKSSQEVIKAFSPLFEKYKPLHIWVDEGKEFYNKEMTTLLKKYDITRYSTYSEHKSAVVERFNRTIKTIIWKYFISAQTRDWISVIEQFTDEYNQRTHSTIKMSPVDALKNEDKVRKIYEKRDIKLVKYQTEPLLQVGDFVRVSRQKGIFEKAINPNWSTEVYIIHEVIDSNPPTYVLVDKLGEVTSGSFYENELQKTQLQDFMLINKVIRKRTYQGKKQLYVSFIGYDDKFNQWMNESDVTITFK